MKEIDVAIIELNLLKEIKFNSSLFSDLSNSTMLYRNILDMISDREQKILKPNESKTVNRNERIRQVCEYGFSSPTHCTAQCGLTACPLQCFTQTD